MKRALFLAGACAVYSLAAWSVRPGFYDSFPAPQYDYVSPPPVLAPGNIAPTPGSADVTEAGGFVATRDQPIAQASIRISPGTLTGPAHVDVKPYAPPHPGDVTLEGNVYCVTANTTLKPGSTAEVTLLLPANEPFPSAMYYSPTQTGPWTSLGGQVDLATYLMTASTKEFGCFAVGYPTPKHEPGPTLRGSLLPLITAALILVVVLAGLPLAVRRRYNRR